MTDAQPDVFAGYIEDVLDGEIVAGRLVQLACERHLQDLESGWERGLFFNPKRALLAIDFFPLLVHIEGRWAEPGRDRRIILEPWQRFVVGSIFGWMRACCDECGGLDCELTQRHYRRFREAYIQVARKNGKSTILGGVGAYMTLMDMEPGAQVYAAATKKDQARITHGYAQGLIFQGPLRDHFERGGRDNINVPTLGSRFEVLGRDSNTDDGLNVHGAIVDELHAHRTRGMYDVLRSATGARTQPLLACITTAGILGFGDGICKERRDYSVDVLHGVVQGDRHFAYVAELDEEDDHWDPANFGKANPNLGVSIQLEDLVEEAEEARAVPALQNTFLQKRLDRWVAQTSRAMNMDHWKACQREYSIEDLEGQFCYAGLDLSDGEDLTSLVLFFPDSGRLLPFFWMPSDNIQERVHKGKVPYDRWLADGFITATPGNSIDYDWIRYELTGTLPDGRPDLDTSHVPLMERFELKLLAYDRWGAKLIRHQLEDDGVELEMFGQGFASMAGPTRELVKVRVPGQRIFHNGHPVLTWNASNLAIKLDPAGNMKPDKSASGDKIDGTVAAIMALGCAMDDPEPRESVYETRGLLEFKPSGGSDAKNPQD